MKMAAAAPVIIVEEMKGKMREKHEGKKKRVEESGGGGVNSRENYKIFIIYLFNIHLPRRYCVYNAK